MTCRTTREDTPIGGARARHRWTAFDKCAVSAAAIVRASANAPQCAGAAGSNVRRGATNLPNRHA
jgi:hypothetical protein